MNVGVGLPTALVGRLFAEAGATVHHGPMAGATENRYPGVRHWATPRVTAGDVTGLLDRADVVVVGGESTREPSSPALDPNTLAARHRRAVVVDIQGYLPGVDDPTPACDLLVQARIGMTGELSSTGATPVAFAPTVYGAALLATLGAWAALVDREATGRGGVVRSTLQQGAALFWPHLWMRSDTPHLEFDAVPPRDVRHLIFRTRDDRYVQLVLGVPRAVAKLYLALGVEAPTDPDDRGAPDPARGPLDYFARRAPIASAIARLDQVEVLARLVDAGIPAGAVGELRDALVSEQAQVNGLVAQDAGGTRWGAHAVDVVQLPPAAGGGRVATGWVPSGRGPGPLTGLRVVDFGNWVAGPFATKLLADLGADVVSVEPPTGLSNLTGVRNTVSANRGKRSIVVDVKSPEGRELSRRLVAWADVVAHNLRYGAAERLGLDAVSVREVNPAVVHLHATSFGRAGPWAERGGFDMVGQAVGGHEVRAGGEGNEPLWTRSPFIDYGTGALGAIGLVAGVHARLVTGRAQDVHVSLLGTAVFLRSDCVVDAHGVARGQLRLDHERRGFAPVERVYETADGWIAVVAPDDVSAAALARWSGGGDPSVDRAAAVAQLLQPMPTARALLELREIGGLG